MSSLSAKYAKLQNGLRMNDALAALNNIVGQLKTDAILDGVRIDSDFLYHLDQIRANITFAMASIPKDYIDE